MKWSPSIKAKYFPRANSLRKLNVDKIIYLTENIDLNKKRIYPDIKFILNKYRRANFEIFIALCDPRHRKLAFKKFI